MAACNLCESLGVAKPLDLFEVQIMLLRKDKI
jgi:hypothetical protein